MTASETRYCARHPKVETAMTCPTCGTPICPDCMVVTPVGMKCRDCGLQKGGALFQVGVGRLILAALVSLVAGAVASMLGFIGFFIIFVATAYGYFAGSVIMKVAGMKRGIKMEVTTGVGMVIGGLGWTLMSTWLPLAVAGAKIPPVELLAMIANPWRMIAIGIATVCAVSKVRYL